MNLEANIELLKKVFANLADWPSVIIGSRV